MSYIMRPREQDENELADDDAYTIEHEVTLESIDNQATINSTIASNYAAQWEPVEAFREIVQNW